MNAPALHWYPKPFGDGDIDGDGSKRLLGGPSLDWLTVLVRETAQNSWDARLPGLVPEYLISMRQLAGDPVRLLRDHVFPQSSDSLGLAQALAQDTLTVIEIADRNTRGLGGPTRSDLAFFGEPTDFRDFVLALGAQRDNDLGGGTYGFGKTASYAASQVGTIVIWTCTATPSGELEHRFVGSAIGSHFTDGNGRRYTGRQWWGAPPPEDSSEFRVRPLIGHDAEQLGTALFEHGFAPGQTGTSILVLAPRSVEADAFEESSRLPSIESIVLTNLWPKLIPGQPDDRRMDIRVCQDGQAVELAMTDRVMTQLGKCLTSVREVQAGREPQPGVTVTRIESLRPKQLLGHLALAKVALPEPDRFAQTNTVTTMRNRAELVVNTISSTNPPAEGEFKAWVGVFKPIAEVDDAFAAAEPPTHDAWISDGMTDPRQKSYVRVALSRISEARDRFLNPDGAGGNPAGTSPTARLARELGSLLAGVPGPGASEPTGRTTGPRAPRTKDRPTVIVTATALWAEGAGSHARINLRAEGPAGMPLKVQLSHLAVAVDGGRLDDPALSLDHWLLPDGQQLAEDVIQVQAGDEFAALISVPAELAIDLAFEVSPCG